MLVFLKFRQDLPEGVKDSFHVSLFKKGLGRLGRFYYTVNSSSGWLLRFDEDAGNLLVQVDNLLVLKALLPHQAGTPKCIHIDPMVTITGILPHPSDETARRIAPGPSARQFGRWSISGFGSSSE